MTGDLNLHRYYRGMTEKGLQFSTTLILIIAFILAGCIRQFKMLVSVILRGQLFFLCCAELN